MLNVILLLLYKCVQSEKHRETIDLLLLKTTLEWILVQHVMSPCRIRAMMVLSFYTEQIVEANDSECLKLSSDDIKTIDKMTKCKDETAIVLHFLKHIKSIENNGSTLCCHGGLELLSGIIDSSEVEADIEVAALLLESLLSGDT